MSTPLFVGKRVGFAAELAVYVVRHGSEVALRGRHDLRNHSPSGFECGYEGSGPAQLALAMCAHHLGDDELALAVYQEVKRELVAKLPRNGPWTVSREAFDDLLVKIGTAPRPPANALAPSPVSFQAPARRIKLEVEVSEHVLEHLRMFAAEHDCVDWQTLPADYDLSATFEAIVESQFEDWELRLLEHAGKNLEPGAALELEPVRPRCPTCDSPDPQRHPALQYEGEVQPCADPFHGVPPW